MMEQTDHSEYTTFSPRFSQVLIKSEPGSTSSLLSIDSPVLQKTSPKQFVIAKEIEKNIEEELITNVNSKKNDISKMIIKVEPLNYSVLDHNTHDKCELLHQQKTTDQINNSELLTQTYDCPKFNDNDIEDDIQAKKLQIIENETTVYRCQQCEGVFKKYVEFKMHKTEHSIEKRTCKICHILFQGVVKLNEHMNVHQGIKPFKCIKCKKCFTSAHTLKCHMESHRTENSFKCEKCGKNFKTRRSLRGHSDTHAKRIKEYTCKICRKEFDFPTEYRLHLAEHGAEPPQPKCSICDKVFKHESQLKSHLRTHKELKFPCEYCNKIFSSMTKIRKHVKRTHVINECEFCKEVFYDKAEFARHKKTVHVEARSSMEGIKKGNVKNASKITRKKKPNICKYCNKAYDKQKNLQEHVRVQHTKDGLENKCEICDKTFINRFLLNNHIKTHDKCFRCPSCNRQFSSRYNLQLHSVTHTNEKRYKCTLCSKAYSLKVSLQTHISTHSEDRPYACSKCDKTFKNNRRLYVHKTSHETELKFECYTCGNKFKTKGYLKAHMYKHYKVRPFDCSHCAKQFKHKKTLEKHVNTKHLRTQRGKRKTSKSAENAVIKKETQDEILNQEKIDQELDENYKGKLQQNENFINLNVSIKMEVNGPAVDTSNIRNKRGAGSVEGEYNEDDGVVHEQKRKCSEQRLDVENVKVELNDE